MRVPLAPEAGLVEQRLWNPRSLSAHSVSHQSCSSALCLSAGAFRELPALQALCLPHTVARKHSLGLSWITG